MNYLEKKRKMLNMLGRTCGDCVGVKCKDCPLYCEYSSCGTFEMEYPEEAERRIDEFLKKDKPYEVHLYRGSDRETLYFESEEVAIDNMMKMVRDSGTAFLYHLGERIKTIKVYNEWYVRTKKINGVITK